MSHISSLLVGLGLIIFQGLQLSSISIFRVQVQIWLAFSVGSYGWYKKKKTDQLTPCDTKALLWGQLFCHLVYPKNEKSCLIITHISTIEEPHTIATSLKIWSRKKMENSNSFFLLVNSIKKKDKMQKMYTRKTPTYKEKKMQENHVS